MRAMRYASTFEPAMFGGSNQHLEATRVVRSQPVLPTVPRSPKAQQRPLGGAFRASTQDDIKPTMTSRCPTILPRAGTMIQSGPNLTLGQVLGALAKKRVEKSSTHGGGRYTTTRQVISAPNLDCDTPRESVNHTPLMQRRHLRAARDKRSGYTRRGSDADDRGQQTKQAWGHTTANNVSAFATNGTTNNTPNETEVLNRRRQLRPRVTANNNNFRMAAETKEKRILRNPEDVLHISTLDPHSLESQLTLQSVKTVLDQKQVATSKRVHLWLSDCNNFFGYWGEGQEDLALRDGVPKNPDDDLLSYSVSGAQS